MHAGELAAVPEPLPRHSLHPALCTQALQHALCSDPCISKTANYRMSGSSGCLQITMTVLGHRALTYRRLFFLFVGGRGKGPELRIRILISSVALSKPEPQSVHEEHHALSHLTELSRAPVNTANCGCAWGKLNSPVYRGQLGAWLSPQETIMRDSRYQLKTQWR